MADITLDTVTQGNHNEIATQHVAFDWHVDFATKTLSGTASHDMKVKESDVEVAM